jgi:hypothetical protein
MSLIGTIQLLNVKEYFCGVSAEGTDTANKFAFGIQGVFNSDPLQYGPALGRLSKREVSFSYPPAERGGHVMSRP